MKKFISVLVVAVLLCTAFVACNKSEGETTSAKVTVTIEADGTKILDNVSVTVEGVDGEAPVALDAVLMAMDENEVTYETGELAGSPKLEKIADYDTENNKYIWELYINDKEADARISAAEIEEGDKIVIVRNEGVEATDTDETTEATTEITETVKNADDGYEE